MKRPVAKIINHLRRLATFASDVSDHSQRLAKVANLRFALLHVQSKRTFNRTIAVDCKQTKSYQNNFSISVTIICKKVTLCLIRLTIKSAVNYCCRIIRLNLKMMVSAQGPISRKGPWPLPPIWVARIV